MTVFVPFTRAGFASCIWSASIVLSHREDVATYIGDLGTQLIGRLSRNDRYAMWVYMSNHPELKVGTQCSGTDCPVLALTQLADSARAVLCREFGDVEFAVSHSYSAELNKVKRWFISTLLSPDRLFGDCMDVVQPYAPDYMHDTTGKALVTFLALRVASPSLYVIVCRHIDCVTCFVLIPHPCVLSHLYMSDFILSIK